MIEYLILDQSDLKIVRGPALIIQDNRLWDQYLREICLLRGKVYIEEGLYMNKILTRDGQFREAWDRDSVHVVALDNGKVVGSVRITFLQQGETFRRAEIDTFLKKFKLPKHINTFNHLLSSLTKRGRKVTELSRLIVQEEYRRYRNVHSTVSGSLFAVSYSYGIEAGVNDALILQGNKYRTGDIYKRMGFKVVKDKEANADLEPFFDGDDICQLMHLELENPTLFFFRFIKKLKLTYRQVKIIKREC